MELLEEFERELALLDREQKPSSGDDLLSQFEAELAEIETAEAGGVYQMTGGSAAMPGAGELASGYLQQGSRAVGVGTKALASGTETTVGSAGDITRWFAEKGQRAAIKGPFSPNAAAGPVLTSVANYIYREGVPDRMKSFVANVYTKVAEAGKGFSERMSRAANTGWEAPDPKLAEGSWLDRPWEKTASAVGSGAPSWLTALAVGVATKNPELPALILGFQAGAGTYARQRDRGASIDKADALATAMAAWETATEKVAFDVIFHGTAKTLLQRLVKTGSVESLQELVQGIGENWLEYFGYNTKQWQDVPNAVKVAFAHTLDGWFENMVAGFALGTIGGAVVKSDAEQGTAEDQAGAIKKELEAFRQEAPLDKDPPVVQMKDGMVAKKEGENWTVYMGDEKFREIPPDTGVEQLDTAYRQLEERWGKQEQENAKRQHGPTAPADQQAKADQLLATVNEKRKKAGQEPLPDGAYKAETAASDTQKAAEAVLTKGLDLDVVWTRATDPEGAFWNGAHLQDRTVFLDVGEDTEAPFLETAMHEFTHVLSEEGGETWQGYLAAVKKHAKGEAEYSQRLRARAQAAGIAKSENLDELTDGEWEDLAADVMSDLAVEPEFWADLKTNSPNVAERIAAMFAEWIRNVRERLAGNRMALSYIDESGLEKVRHHALQAVSKHIETVESERAAQPRSPARLQSETRQKRHAGGEELTREELYEEMRKGEKWAGDAFEKLDPQFRDGVTVHFRPEQRLASAKPLRGRIHAYKGAGQYEVKYKKTRNAKPVYHIVPEDRIELVNQAAVDAKQQKYWDDLNTLPEAERSEAKRKSKEFDDLLRKSMFWNWQLADEASDHEILRRARREAADELGMSEEEVERPTARAENIEKLQALLNEQSAEETESADEEERDFPSGDLEADGDVFESGTPYAAEGLTAEQIGRIVPGEKNEEEHVSEGAQYASQPEFGFVKNLSPENPQVPGPRSQGMGHGTAGDGNAREVHHSRLRDRLTKIGRIHVPHLRISQPEQAAEILWEIRNGGQEKLVFLPLAKDRRVMPCGPVLLTMGLSDRSAAPIQLILRALKLTGADRFVLAHNHPSGDPTPSSEDLRMTLQTKEALTAIGRPAALVDHIIINGVNAFSMSGEKMVPYKRLGTKRERPISIMGEFGKGSQEYDVPSDELPVAFHDENRDADMRLGFQIDSPSSVVEFVRKLIGKDNVATGIVVGLNVKKRVVAAHVLPLEAMTRLRAGELVAEVGGEPGVTSLLMARSLPDRQAQAAADEALPVLKEAAKKTGIKLLDIVDVFDPAPSENPEGRRSLKYTSHREQGLITKEAAPGSSSVEPLFELKDDILNMSRAELERRLARLAPHRARPDLAMPTKRPPASRVVDAVDQLRNELGIPDRETVEQWQKDADAALQGKGEDALWRELVAGKLDMTNAENTLIGKQLLNSYGSEAIRSMDPDKLREAMVAAHQYRSARTEIARAMRAGFDPNKSRVEQVRAFVNGAFLDPGNIKLDLNNMSDAQLQATLADALAKLAKVKEALKKKGIDLDNLTEEQVADPASLADLVREIQTQKAGKADMLYEYWLNWGLLSGPATHAANMLGNTLYATGELTLQRVVEATINLVAKKSDAATFGEFRYMTRALKRNFRQGLSNGALAWQTEQPVVGRSEKVELSDRGGAIPGQVGRIARVPTRSLLAADEFAKSILLPIEANAKAYRMAKAEGLSGQGLEDRMLDLVNDPTSEANVWAMNRALELTFQKKLGGIGQMMLNFRTIPFYGWVAKYLLPFVTTPSNIIKTTVRKSPLGLMKMLGKAGFGGYKGNADLATRHVAEQVVAWGTVAAIWSLMGDEDDDELPRITGSKPGYFQKGKYGFMMENLPPASMRIGDRWFSYQRLEPFAGMITMIVDGIHAWKDADNDVDGGRIMKNLFNSGLQNVRDKTFLQTVGDVIRATEDPNTSGRLMTNFAASWAPNAIRTTLRAMDDEIRDSRNYDRGAAWLGEQLGDKTLERIGVKRALPKVNLWGEDLKKTENFPLQATNVAWRILSPVYAAKPDWKPAEKLIWNFNRNNPNHANGNGYWPGIPAWWYTQDGETKYMTAKQHTRLCKTAGKKADEILTRLISGGSLNVANPTERDRKIVEKVFAKSRAYAKRQVLP